MFCSGARIMRDRIPCHVRDTGGPEGEMKSDLPPKCPRYSEAAAIPRGRTFSARAALEMSPQPGGGGGS